MMLKSA